MASSSDASVRYTVLRRRIVVLGILVIVALAGFQALGLWLSHREEVEATRRELDNLSRALSEQTAWTWEAIDLLVKDTARWYVVDGRGQSKAVIDGVLANRAAGMRQVRVLTIADENGIQRYRSDGYVVPGLDISKRSYFIAMRDGTSTGLFITEPMVTKRGERNSVVLSRRLEDDNGSFLGVVTATVDLEALKELYGSLKLASGNAITLFRSDGTLLVRDPPAPELVGRKYPTSLIAEAPLRLRSRLDGSPVFVAIARVRDAPLVLAVSRKEDAALGIWRDRAGIAVVRTVGLSLLAALTIIALVRQLDQIEAGERALLESKERQAQSQKLEALGSLAGGIAHDFNNILGAILGYGELAQQQAPEGDAVRRYVDNVMLAAARAKILVDGILGFSRGGMTDRTPVNIQEVMEETLELLEPSLPAEIRLEKRLAAGDAAVIGDSTHLHQVAMNLCTNAVQAMQTGGTLCVTLERRVIAEARSVMRGSVLPALYVVLTVSDTGTGIPQEVLQRVFDPFFTTKGVGEGTGLGLALVDGIVHDLGGAIDVSTRPGEGTEFNIWLPVAGEVPRSVDELPTELSYGSGQTVMIVDDERMLVSLAEEMLAGLGYEPVGFDVGAAALHAFRRAPMRFTMVVTDENMPGLSGIELTRELRRLRPDIPVVLMSGYGGPQLAERAAAAGITQVLRKPLQRRDLSEALARILGSAARGRACQL